MNKTSGFSSINSTPVLKRDYRILRSKVLKLLDQKFFHPSDDVAQYEARMATMQSAFKKIRDQEYLESLENNTKFPKLFDYTFYNPDLKTIRHAKSEKPHKKLKELEILKIDNLCKYLTLDEIELVCEDPIYFLGREEYRVKAELNDHKGWNRQLGLVKEKRKKEQNWKETMETIRSEFRTSPSMGVYEQMRQPLKTMRNKEFNNKQELKESVCQKIMRSHSRKIMARNNQMNALVKMRKLEELENKKDKEYEWKYNAEEKHIKVLEKKKEALDLITKDKQNARKVFDKKLEIKKKNLLDNFAVKKMTLEIDHLFKTKMAQECKFKDVQNKVDKARTFTDFKFRKPLFLSKKGMDKEIDSSYSQSVSTK